MFDVMKSGAIVANSGHFDVEINKGDLDALTESTYEARPLVEGHRLKDGREIFLLAEGRLVNLASAEGHPAAVMDMSFANQALAAEYMALNHEDLETRVHPVPRMIDEEIARLKLASKGINIDTLTEAQRKYLASWDQGT
jgi:adenosylhomocysteinase